MELLTKIMRLFDELGRKPIVKRLALVLILILGFLVRLYKIESPIADWHSWRQVDTASVSRIYVDEGINVLRPRYYDISRIQTGIFNHEGLRMVEFPIYNVLHALLAKGFPVIGFEVWGRLVSIGASLLSVVFLYLIGKHFYGEGVGLLSAFFLALTPYNIFFSRTILPEPLAVFFGLAAIYFFAKGLKNNKTGALYLAGIFFAAATLIKPFVFFYGVALIFLAVNQVGWKGIFTQKRFLVFADLAIIPFFAWRVWINQFPQGIPHFSWAFNGDKIRFRPAFWKWIFAERIGKLLLGGWGLIPFSFGFLKTKKENLFAIFFFLGMVAYVAIFATANVRHDYYQIYLVPPVALLLAKGASFMWHYDQLTKLWFIRGLTLFCLGLVFLVGYTEVKGNYSINHPEIIAAGQAIDRLVPKDALVVAPYNGDTAFLYQTKRFGWPVVDESFDDLIGRGADYFVAVNFADPDVAYVRGRFKILEETGQYLIADLHQEVGPK